MNRLSATLWMPDESTEITCRHQDDAARPQGYPVLCIGDLTIFPTLGRLRRLKEVIAAYLAAEPKADAVEEDDREMRNRWAAAYREGIVASPQPGPDPTPSVPNLCCPDCGSATLDRTGHIVGNYVVKVFTCKNCGRRSPRGELKPQPEHEAAVEVDELPSAMAASFEPHRESRDDEEVE